MGQKASMHGSSTTSATRGPQGTQRGLFDLTTRALIGQLAQPPNMAISVPMQQAISTLQAGQTGGILGRLTAGQGQDPATFGLRTREQLGLPDRKSYFPGVPSFEEVAALGALPPIRPAKGTEKTAKETGNLPRNKKERRGKQSPELHR